LKLALLLANASSAGHTEIPPLLILPFGVLLLLIATMPLSPAKVKHFWEHNYPLVALGLATFVAAFYLLKIPGGGTEIVHTAKEYFSFIVLIGSLFVVAGGIHIKTSGEASPIQNVIFLLIGGVLANFVGTTGASMVLIRPYIRMNKIRITAYHIVFFIFVVSNIGGALTPIGDPPLFLGYLRGVPFFWLVEKVMLQWVVTIVLILGVFYFYDRHFYARVPRKLQQEIDKPNAWQFEGGINVLFLLAIIGAVFVEKVPFLREAIMIGAAVASYFLTSKKIHAENAFSFGPIKEVAFLFAGIFMTMMPALGYIDAHGKDFKVRNPTQYYFASGSLSAVLDNAPTYATFLRLAEATAQAEHPADFANAKTEPDVVKVLLSKPEYSLLVIAVSLGSVFFGAMTYIGNGPNFMVKSIAESAGVKVPTFFGYVFKYSLPVLFPILAFGAWLFL
jgi:Na+/H+ antiporter NhaD/arsenite permease-like protein